MADVHIPEDIIFNIFVRMPTKALVRFKCLSKHWNRLISHFIESRFRRMVLLPVQPSHAIHIREPGTKLTHKMVKLRSPFKKTEDEEVTVAGTFNGIVLLVFDNQSPADMILYNPFTEASKIVPHHYLNSSDGYNYAYGFGYGTNPEDLKIVRLRVNDKIREDLRCCDIFSLKNGSWTTPLRLNGHFSFIQYTGTFVNGILYWIVFHKGLSILAFDIKEMVFSEIDGPPGCTFDCLGTLKGQLCVICFNNSLVEHELWVMNGHSRKPWSKARLLKRITKKDLPLCILDDGKVVLLNADKLIIYDSLKDSYRKVNPLGGLPRVYRKQAIGYVESCVSPTSLCSRLF